MTTTATPATLTDLAGTWTIDATHTRIGFVARHAMVTKVRGAFNEFEGTVTYDAVRPEKIDARVTIKAASIDTRNAQRDAHLRSNDFLAMETYPDITFISTEIRQTGADTFDLYGDLTIRGITKPVTIPFTFDGTAIDPYGNQRLGFEGAVTINRKDFGVNWNAALEAGGVLVSEKVVLEFEVAAIKDKN